MATPSQCSPSPVSRRGGDDSTRAHQVEVYRLRDACATLQLALLAHCRAVSSAALTDHALADYVACGAAGPAQCCTTVTVASTAGGSSASLSSPPLVCVGVSSRTGLPVCLQLPSYAAVSYDYSIAWAHVAAAEMSRQYAGRCIIAKLQTVGGGWASLHRADRALLCALQLCSVAVAVFDEEVVRKCRLFIGWAHLWNSDPQRALAVFKAELAAARARDDVVHERRCLHAIHNAEKNPHLRPGGAYTDRYDLVDCWSSAFA